MWDEQKRHLWRVSLVTPGQIVEKYIVASGEKELFMKLGAERVDPGAILGYDVAIKDEAQLKIYLGED